MVKITVTYIDGLSKDFELDDIQFKKIIAWIEDGSDNSGFNIKYDIELPTKEIIKCNVFVFKHAIKTIRF